MDIVNALISSILTPEEAAQAFAGRAENPGQIQKYCSGYETNFYKKSFYYLATQ